MKKTLLYRLFRLGSVPKKMRPMLADEGIVVLDEGIGGSLVTRHMNAPGKRIRHRREGFSGFLAITKVRVVCYTYGKRQINISVNDPKVSHLYVETPKEDRLYLSFESSDFREGWKGVIELRFKTDKAPRFRDALLAIGAQQGPAFRTETENSKKC